jgi:hypothetical protein
MPAVEWDLDRVTRYAHYDATDPACLELYNGGAGGIPAPEGAEVWRILDKSGEGQHVTAPAAQGIHLVGGGVQTDGALSGHYNFANGAPFWWVDEDYCHFFVGIIDAPTPVSLGNMAYQIGTANSARTCAFQFTGDNILAFRVYALDPTGPATTAYSATLLGVGSGEPELGPLGTRGRMLVGRRKFPDAIAYNNGIITSSVVVAPPYTKWDDDAQNVRIGNSTNTYTSLRLFECGTLGSGDPLSANKIQGFLWHKYKNNTDLIDNGFNLYVGHPYEPSPPLYGTTIEQGDFVLEVEPGVPTDVALSAIADVLHSVTWRVISGPATIVGSNRNATLTVTLADPEPQLVIVGAIANDGSIEEFSFIDVESGYTSTRYEAEEGLLTDGVTVSTEHPGYTGAGYCDYPASSIGSVEWDVIVSKVTTAYIYWRYGNGGGGSRPLNLYVNDVYIDTIDMSPTGGWSTWDLTATLAIALNSGTNKVRLSAEANSGPNVDHMMALLDPAALGIFGLRPPNAITQGNAGLHPVVRCRTELGMHPAVGIECAPATHGQYNNQYNNQYD